MGTGRGGGGVGESVSLIGFGGTSLRKSGGVFLKLVVVGISFYFVLLSPIFVLSLFLYFSISPFLISHSPFPIRISISLAAYHRTAQHRTA